MKLLATCALVGLAALTANAQAATITNTTDTAGGSDLVLFVTNATNTAFYIKDLGVQLDSLVSKSKTATDPVINANTSPAPGAFNTPGSLNTAADSGLAAFLSANPGSSWSVLGADTTGTGNGPGDKRFAATFAANPAQNPFVNLPTSANVNTAASGTRSFFLDVNAMTVNGGSTTAIGWGGTGGTNSVNAPISFIAPSYQNGATVGTAQSFYLLASHNSTGPTNTRANVYLSSNSITLNADGSLSVAPVPIPAAVWLLGTGLLGFAGIGRRRAA